MSNQAVPPGREGSVRDDRPGQQGPAHRQAHHAAPHLCPGKRHNTYYSSVRRWEKGGSIPLPRNLPAHASDATVPLVYAEHDSLSYLNVIGTGKDDNS